MSVEQVLQTVSDRGLTLRLDGTDLRLEGPQSRIDSALVASIRAVKAEIVAHLAGLRADPSGTNDAGFASTPMQQSYFYGRQDNFALGGVASHVYHEIEGVFDIDRLQRALGIVVQRHGALRTVFRDDELQIELDSATFVSPRIAVTDLRGDRSDLADRTATRLATRKAMSHQRLPANRAPLIDVRLTIQSDTNMVLHVSHDGLIMDGISSFLFFRDWWRFYQYPNDAVPPLDISFRHYVEALTAGRSGREAERARRYWLDRLDGIAPHPQLPCQVDPDTVRCPVFTRHTVEVDAPRWAHLKRECVRAGLTPTAMLASAYADVLSLWGGGDQFTLNMTIANRLQIHPDIDQVVGNFTDCLLLSVEIDGSDGFRTRALKLQARLREALDHRHFSGIDVMRALGRQRGLVQAAPMSFTFNSTIGAVQDGSSIAAFGRETYAVSQTPQVLLNVFLLERNAGLVVEIDAVEEVFPEGLIPDLVGAYQRLLHALADEPAEWERSDHALLPRHQLARRREVNRTDTPVPSGQAHASFVAQAVRAPNAVAVVTSSRRISYGALRAAAGVIADRLRRLGVKRNDLVAVVMRKGWEEIAGILGILLAGGAYLPVSANLPKRRVAEILREGRVQFILTQGDGVAAIGDGYECVVVDAGLLDAEAEEYQPVMDGDPSDLAYVLYTSGSTGRAKGVMVSHRSIVNLVADMTRRFEIGSADRFFAVTQTSFDLSVFDIFGALSVGAALVIPDGDAELDSARWLALAADNGVTIWNSVPTTAEALLDEAKSSRRPPLRTLRLVMLSGDRIPVTLPARLMALDPKVRVIALGGPTETTVWNILYPIEAVDPAWKRIPYGKPSANNRYYVLDAFLRECPDHVPGELYAAGIGLADGYWSDPELTAAKFIRHEPLGERLYRTGDIGCYRPDGNIEILGRADFQVKLNGYRLEPAEIEMVLEEHAAVTRAAVVLRANPGQVAQLVAFVVPANRETSTELENALTLELSRALPSYMVPQRFVWLERLPLTSNGKVDRQHLQEVVLEEEAEIPLEHHSSEAAQTELESHLAAIWSDILRLNAIDANSQFFELGGTSLKAVRLLARVRKEFRVSVPLTELPRFQTPRAMARHIESQTMRAVS